jgi:hypothetical protein
MQAFDPMLRAFAALVAMKLQERRFNVSVVKCSSLIPTRGCNRGALTDADLSGSAQFGRWCEDLVLKTDVALHEGWNL